MTDLSTTDVHSRTITAFFDTREAAQRASDDLVSAGIPQRHIQLTEGGQTGTSGTTSTTATGDKGFWDELKDLFLPDEDRYGYAEGLRRGGFLLSVKADEAMYTQVVDILDRDGAINMDEREASWRASGWTGYETGAAVSGYETGAASTGYSTIGSGVAGSASSAGTLGSGTGMGDLSQSTASLASTTAGTAVSGRSAPVDTLQSGRDEVIPVYEETARVAKRDVNQGRVRIRSYVVETPFSEQVNLRQEQVQVERRPVDRPIVAGDAVFQDRVIEAEEHVEEAVITKEARVKEEISLRKTVQDQAQTMTDTLRRTEVEVDDQRTGRGLGATSAFTGATDTSRITEQMDVIGADGTKIGTVDHLDGDRIKLAKNTSPDGQHHYVPLAWISRVDTHVHLSKSSSEAKAQW